MKIDDLLGSAGPTAYYSDFMRRALEDQMTILRNAGSSRSLPVDPMLAYRFAGDLFGLLRALRIPAELHYTVMRMNQLTSRFEIPENMMSVLVPDPGYIDTIRQQITTESRLN